MTLSCQGMKSTPRVRPAPRGLPKPLPMLRSAGSEIAAAYAEVTSSALFGPVLLRVGTSLFAGFWLVHLAKALTS